jgi:hypothetical protein
MQRWPKGLSAILSASGKTIVLVKKESGIMQKEIIEGSALFDNRGKLTQTGWARQLIMNYNREKMRVSMFRLKEWDCYCLLCPEFQLNLIVADIGYFGMAHVNWLDYPAKKDKGSRAVKLLTRGNLNLPRTADTGDVEFFKGDSWIKFKHIPGEFSQRELSFNFPGHVFEGRKGISGQVTLTRDPKDDTMVNVIPFKDPRHFVYVQKIVCMPAVGTVKLEGDRYEFKGKENNSYASLDWSRGVFPYRTEWWWSYASGTFNGKSFGFNIDYGFGTESSKSMLFYDGKGHHLGEVTYTYDEKNPQKPWRYSSSDNRVNLKLEPVYSNKEDANLLMLRSQGLHVYGFITGEAVLDDGTKLTIKRTDRIFGSAEYCKHRW